MMSLRALFRKNTGWLRSLKLSYVINNLLSTKQLQHNRPLYKKYGLRKSIYAPIGSQDFPKPSADIPWLDQPDAKKKLRAHPEFGKFSVATQQQLAQFIERGYMILEGFFDEAAVALLNANIEQLLQKGALDFNYTGRKIVESFRVSEVANRFFRHPELLHLLSFILGKKVIPFQTINFLEGSEQRAHVDFIHMTTEPRGYLIAAWMALEDCHADNGPLFYYPGSHRLPYTLSSDYPSGNTKWTIGAESNRHYEDKIEAIIQQQGLQKQHFHAQKGDVLIWHANLIHGGEAIRRAGATRKSMVAHYFAEEVICYHEISQRPALLEINS
ncbi:MAG TPA: phytanoyl-CoA dioxygenase family protein [Saprospiraceae bacterium]|nr:phytanoyl-CoA dioxygenase family protein [Saprospiraceae bacterium]HMP23431.1 phytanoyl-CoA dioxygenase family protein [Saprospiraceae bacterium]